MRHKLELTFVFLLIAVISFLLLPSSLNPLSQNQNDPRKFQIAEKFNITNPREFSIKNYQIEGNDLSIWNLGYGNDRDCYSGCFHSTAGGLIVNNNIFVLFYYDYENVFPSNFGNEPGAADGVETIHINASNQFLLSEQVRGILKASGYQLGPGVYRSFIYEAFIREIAEDQSVPTSYLQNVYDESDDNVKMALFQKTNDTSLLIELAIRIKSNEVYSYDVQTYLKDIWVFIVLASHPSTAPDILEKIFSIQEKSKYPDDGVLSALLSNPSLPRSLYDKIVLEACQSGSFKGFYSGPDAQKLLKHVNDTLLLSQCENSSSEYVKCGILENPNSSEEIKKQVAGSLPDNGTTCN